MASERGPRNLDKVDTIVVVMLENRSFDHMLGYLSLENGRQDVDGLRPDLANEYGGRRYPVHHLDHTRVIEDPDHSAAAVDEQIGDDRMDGFVSTCAAALASRGIEDGDPGVVMGYYNGADAPVFGHLADRFLICDRWFSSVPGATLPNRLYSLCGKAAGSRDDLPTYVPPIYHQASFIRHLDARGVSWRWYSFDPGTLRLADMRYRLGCHDRFAYFSKTGLPWKSVLDITVNSKAASFIEDAARGTLPSVSWIDPAFTNFNPLGFPVCDDHPPADISDGQDLVLAVYDALAASPQWERSLLVIVYDEHGGFFDHVPPPTSVDDDPETFGRYGVRVPAIIVSPWVAPGSVAHDLFDHTSLIKTILLRFCPDALDDSGRAPAGLGGLDIGHPQPPGARVIHANNLGPCLSEATPRAAPPRDALIGAAASRTSPPDPDGGRTAQAIAQLTDLQKRMLAATHDLARLGHPEGTP